MPSVVVRVWLPDRPGALGLVASRIGAIGGDIVGIDVLERGEDIAVDEFAVQLRNPAALDIMVREIEEVDGVGDGRMLVAADGLVDKIYNLWDRNPMTVRASYLASNGTRDRPSPNKLPSF